MAVLLKGKPVVEAMGEKVRRRVAELQAVGVQPTLAIVRVGDRPDDLSYERTAMRRAASLGVAVKPYVLDAQAPQVALESTLRSINHDQAVHGCLMFRPLPAHVDEAAMCDALAPAKDIDGISSASLSSVFTGSNQGFPPATAQACISILDHYGVSVEGRHVVVIGRSLVIGKPVAMMLLARNASVTVCHSRTENLAAITRMADIVVCAAGRARAFGPEYFSAGQAVLDVGINFDEAGELCGDVDFEAVEPIVGFITPVPGGVGTVTTSVTMAHTVQAAEAAR